MTYEEAKEEAKSRLGEYLASLGVDVGKAQSGSNTVCPVCGKHNFHFYEKNQRWICFSGLCGGAGTHDIFDLYALMNHLSDDKEIFKGVYEMYGIKSDGGANSSPSGLKGKAQSGLTAALGFGQGFNSKKTNREESMEIVAEDEVKIGKWYVEECARRLDNHPEAVKYLRKRGIYDVSESFNIGFDPEWRHPKASAFVPPTPRLIIPCGDGFLAYIARDIREGLTADEKKYSKQFVKGSDRVKIKPFGVSACIEYPDNTKPIYVVEGWADALSIYAVGGSAVALNSTDNVHSFLYKYGTECAEKKLRLILALDNEANARLAEGLAKKGVSFILDNPAGDFKSVNDALINDPSGFGCRVIRSYDEYEAIANRSVASYIDGFLGMMRAERKLIPSGFTSLDKAISGWNGGGLPVGLYVIGAISSLGKTTFALQVADQMAAQGQDVLIFSLEMSRMELIGKSVSRHSFLSLSAGKRRDIEEALANTDAAKAEKENEKQVGRSGFIEKEYLAKKEVLKEVLSASAAFTWSDFRDLRLKQNNGLLGGSDMIKSKEIEACMEAAARKYGSEVAPHLFIEEGRIDGTSMEHIREKVREHKAWTGETPVVIIDYLQMVRPPEGMEGATDKAITDKNILACKVLSRDFDTPVIVISSFSRSAYYADKGLGSFKESGAIEYTADVVLTLQYPDVAKATKEEDAAKKEREVKGKNVRDVQVNILKNRSGAMMDTPTFKFIPMFNTFREVRGAVAPKR